jgi:hypothetical protein
LGGEKGESSSEMAVCQIINQHIVTAGTKQRACHFTTKKSRNQGITSRTK